MKISVITVAYNAADTIADTLASVAAQHGPSFEHIVVDGASTDDTLSVVERNRHPNLRVISEPDRGLYDAMNKGFQAASGDLIGFLNADDFFLRTDSLSLIADAAERDRRDAVAASIRIVESAQPGRMLRHYSAHGFRPWMLRFGHMPPHPGFYATRHSVDRVGLFDTRFRIGADFDWMVRFFHVHRLSATLLKQDIVALRAGGISTRGLKSARIINREASLSAREHGIRTNQALVWMKYFVKIWQYADRPSRVAPGAAWSPSLDQDS